MNDVIMRDLAQVGRWGQEEEGGRDGGVLRVVPMGKWLLMCVIRIISMSLVTEASYDVAEGCREAEVVPKRCWPALTFMIVLQMSCGRLSFVTNRRYAMIAMRVTW